MAREASDGEATPPLGRQRPTKAAIRSRGLGFERNVALDIIVKPTMVV